MTCRAPLIVDALGWRRVLGVGENVQPPNASLSRGLEVHPKGAGTDLELFVDPRYVDAGYGWSFPAGDEVRIGVGSFDPHDPVKQPTLRLVEDVAQRPDGYQGNWIPHRLRPATEDGVFFVGDSAGHCLPLTAEGIRTAFYFGIAAGRELRAVLDGRQDKAAALKRYHRFSAKHRWKFESMYRSQQAIRHLHGCPLDNLARIFTRPRPGNFAFQHYLDIAPPSFAVPAPPAARRCAQRRKQAALTAQPLDGVQAGAQPFDQQLEVLGLARQRRRHRHAAEQRAHQHALLAGARGQPRGRSGVGVRGRRRRPPGSPGRSGSPPPRGDRRACPARPRAAARAPGRARSTPRPRRCRARPAPAAHAAGWPA